jgi:probable phosphoglycerate mutase
MELLLVRHGLPLRVERDDGAPADPPLSDEGRGQAERLAAWLEAERLDAVYTSPLRRALETAEPLAKRQGVAVRIEPGVVEFDPAASAYVPLEEIKALDPRRWRALVQGGLVEGIDLDGFRRVVTASVERIIDAHPGERIAVVCHGGVINSWAAHVLGLATTLFFQPTYTSISRFLASSGGERSVASLNEAPHLREGL